MSYQVRQAIASLVGALVAVLAIWGIDVSWMNEPAIQGVVIAVVSALSSFLPKAPAPREPTLTEAYHVVEAANQARDRQRWLDDQPGGLRADDGHLRPDPQ